MGDSSTTYREETKAYAQEIVGKEKRDGKEVYIISGNIRKDKTEEVIDESINRKAVESIKEQIEIFEKVNVDKVLSDIAPVTVEITADAESFRLIEIKMDKKEATQSIYNNLMKEIGYGQNGPQVPINEAITSIRITGHNSFESITIPDEAKNAQEFPGI